MLSLPEEIISTHALTEGDGVLFPRPASLLHFNSRPHGGRRRTVSSPCFSSAFQLTPSRRATPCPFLIISSSGISTHALTEGDGTALRSTITRMAFQLTPSRRATDLRSRELPGQENFNSRPHGGRPSRSKIRRMVRNFNSRPHGGRQKMGRPIIGKRNFNSRPHGGRRGVLRGCFPSAEHFNSRPHGGRQCRNVLFRIAGKFQLTPSRRATISTISTSDFQVISTHALTEGDFISRIRSNGLLFQLTPSRRATLHIRHPKADSVFQLTPSRRATRSVT